jgi:penicillin amidase
LGAKSPDAPPDASDVPDSPAARTNAAASAQAQERGWLATANQRIHAPDYPHYLTQDWAAPYRQQRIEALLGAHTQHTPETLAAIQGDVYSLASVRLLPHLQAAAQASQHPLAAALRTELARFDGTMAADQAAPLVLVAWADELTRRLLVPRLGEARVQALYGKRHFRATLEHVLEHPDTAGAWCGAGGCALMAQHALDASLQRLQQRHGRHLARWRWGDAHPAVSRHNPLSQVPFLAPWFEVRVPTGGDAFTVNVGQYPLDHANEPYANRHAASLRAIYDLADLENSRFIYQTGQSGHVFSSRYSDMAREWRDVRYRPLQLQPHRWSHTLIVAPTHP